MPSQKLSDTELVDWLRLIRSENVGPTTFKKLISKFGSARHALDALPELSQRGGLKHRIKICSAAQAEAEIEKVEKLGACHLALNEADYPQLLRHIDAAPPVITVKGRKSLANKPILAVVGARNASAVGTKLTTRFVKELCGNGLIIASGLARGIDTAAHKAALSMGTIGVVAGGIDKIYPKENTALHHQIAEEGLLIAENPPGISPKAQHFPRRNRLVSGVALGVLVVEAALRSGSLITARLAAEQGREVFAVPGSPLDPRAKGTNKLLQEGVHLALTASDITGVLEIFSNNTFKETQANKLIIENHQPQQDQHFAMKNESRTQITNLLSVTPVEVDELIRQSHQSPGAVQTVLIELELAGRLIRHDRQMVSLSTV